MKVNYIVIIIYNNDYMIYVNMFNKYKINHHFNLNEIYLLNMK